MRQGGCIVVITAAAHVRRVIGRGCRRADDAAVLGSTLTDAAATLAAVTMDRAAATVASAPRPTALPPVDMRAACGTAVRATSRDTAAHAIVVVGSGGGSGCGSGTGSGTLCTWHSAGNNCTVGVALSPRHI